MAETPPSTSQDVSTVSADIIPETQIATDAPAASTATGTPQPPTLTNTPQADTPQVPPHTEERCPTPGFDDDGTPIDFQSSKKSQPSTSSTGTNRGARPKTRTTSSTKKAAKHRRTSSKKSTSDTKEERQQVPLHFPYAKEPLRPPTPLINANLPKPLIEYLNQLHTSQRTVRVSVEHQPDTSKPSQTIEAYLDVRTMAALANSDAMYMKTDTTGRTKYGPLTLEELDTAIRKSIEPELSALDISDFWRKRPHVPYQHALPVVRLDEAFVPPFEKDQRPSPSLETWTLFEYAHSNVFYNGNFYAANCRHPTTMWEEHPWCTTCLVNYKIPLCGYEMDAVTKVPNSCYICPKMGTRAKRTRATSYRGRLELSVKNKKTAWVKVSKKSLPTFIRDQFFADVSDLPQLHKVKPNPDWKTKGLGYCRPATLVPYFLTEAEYNAANLEGEALKTVCREHIKIAMSQYERQRARRGEDDINYPELPEPTEKQYNRHKKKAPKSKSIITPEFEHYKDPVLKTRTRPSNKRAIEEVEKSSSDDDDVLSQLSDSVLQDDNDEVHSSAYLDTSQSSAEVPDESEQDITDTHEPDTEMIDVKTQQTQVQLGPDIMNPEAEAAILNALSPEVIQRLERTFKGPIVGTPTGRSTSAPPPPLPPFGSIFANTPPPLRPSRLNLTNPNQLSQVPASATVTSQHEAKLTDTALFSSFTSAAPDTSQYQFAPLDTPISTQQQTHSVPVSIVQTQATADTQYQQAQQAQTSEVRTSSNQSAGYYSVMMPADQSLGLQLLASQTAPWHSSRERTTRPVPALQHKFDHATPVQIAGEAAGISTSTADGSKYRVDDLTTDPYQEAARIYVPRSNLGKGLDDRIRSWYSTIPASIGNCVTLDVAGFVPSDISAVPPLAVPDSSGNYPTDADELLITQAEVIRQDGCARGLIKLQEIDELMHLGLRNLTMRQVPQPQPGTNFEEEVRVWADKIARLCNALRHNYMQREELILDTAAITCVQRRRDNSARTHGLVKTQDLVEPMSTSRRTIIADPALAIQTPPQPMSANTSIRSSPKTFSRDPRLSLKSTQAARKPQPN